MFPKDPLFGSLLRWCGCMAATDCQASGRQTYADLVAMVPQPIPDITVASHAPKVMDGELFFRFLKEEIT